MTVNATADASLLIAGVDDGDTYTSVGTTTKSVTNLKPTTSFDGVNFAKLASDVKVKNATDEAATWTGTSGAFADGDLVTAENVADNESTVDVNEEKNYWLEATYNMKSIVEDANVYVSAITLSGTTANIDQAIRVSVTIDGTTKVYNAGAGTTSAEGVGKYADSKWTLAAASYTTINDDSATFALTADEVYSVTIRVWYEGQDANCFTDNISENDKTITVDFTKAE